MAHERIEKFTGGHGKNMELYGSGDDLKLDGAPHEVVFTDRATDAVASTVIYAACPDAAVWYAFKNLQNCSSGVYGNVTPEGVGVNITAQAIHN